MQCIRTYSQCNTFRCEANSGSQTIVNSWYHDSINVTVPAWQMSTTWTATSVLFRFDNAIMALWVLLTVMFTTAHLKYLLQS